MNVLLHNNSRTRKVQSPNTKTATGKSGQSKAFHNTKITHLLSTRSLWRRSVRPRCTIRWRSITPLGSAISGWPVLPWRAPIRGTRWWPVGWGTRRGPGILWLWGPGRGEVAAVWTTSFEWNQGNGDSSVDGDVRYSFVTDALGEFCEVLAIYGNL